MTRSNSGFADGGAKPPNLGSIAGEVRCIAFPAPKVLPEHILKSAGSLFIVAHVEGMLELEQRCHQMDHRPDGLPVPQISYFVPNRSLSAITRPN